MTASYTRIGAMASTLAMMSLAATPCLAAGLTVPTVTAPLSVQFETVIYDSKSEDVDWRRCRGYYCGYGRHRHRGVDAGDVLAGVLIIGGIAAIASAASNNKREEERRDRVRDYEQQRELEQLRQREREQDRELDYLRERGVDAERFAPSGRAGGFGIEGAIDQCSAVVGRESPVADILGASRTANGWSVRGTLQSQRSFSCTIGADGEIESLDYSGSYNAQPPALQGEYRASGQLSDARYANARAALSASQPNAQFGEPQPLVPLTAQRMPAYPGGPIPGEEVDGDLNP